MTFDTFGLSQQMLDALAKKGFEEATSIQALAIPRLLKPGKALAAKARTGTGKTAAFGIPLIEALRSPPAPSSETGEPEWIRGQVRALILVPTRELALQVAEEISSLRGGDRPRVACVYGGASMLEQLRRLASGVDIVVGTPGRVLDHLKRGSMDISRIGHFVLDEADEMLDMGFIEDIEAVMGMMSEKARVVLFSATLARPVLEAVRSRVGEIEIVEDDTDTLTTELAEQVWIEVRERDRLEALSRIIDAAEDFFGIVFVATKVESDRVAKALEERGFDAESLNGDMGQEARERVLAKFKDRRVQALVATDVAARGIDIAKLTHVVNWSLPHDPDSYLHRVGRTGRAGNTGTAITFVTPEEYRKLFRIRQVSGRSLKKGSVPAIDGLIAAKKERLVARIESAFSPVEQAPQAELVLPAEPAPQDEATAVAQTGAAVQTGTTVQPEIPATWLELADTLIGKMGPREALAAALSEGFGAQLDPGKYREIQEITLEGTGITRLFMAVGKRDRMDAKALVALVKRHSGLSDRAIESVEIYDTFSFVTVPFKAAQRLMEVARSGIDFPHVKVATPREPGRRREGGEPFRKEFAPRASNSPHAPHTPHAPYAPRDPSPKGGPGGYNEAPRKGAPGWRKEPWSNASPTFRKGANKKR